MGRWITTTEEERKLIAREMHDQINQLLLSIKLTLESMESSLPTGYANIHNKLETSKSRINQVFDELRELVYNLRPAALDDLGLAQALEWYIDTFSKESGPSIILKVNGLRHWRPAPVVETNLFRITQEALVNVVKHAQATSAKVTLTFIKSNLYWQLRIMVLGLITTL